MEEWPVWAQVLAFAGTGAGGALSGTFWTRNRATAEADGLLKQASQIEAACTLAAIKRNDEIDVINRGLQMNLSEAERERDRLQVETTNLKQLSSGN